MIGYIMLLIIMALILIAYFITSFHYKKAEKLETELKLKFNTEEYEKVRLKVRIKHHQANSLHFPVTYTVYSFKQGYLFFEGKNAIGYATIWLYHNQEDKLFFKNPKRSGEILSIKETEQKIKLYVEHNFDHYQLSLPMRGITYILYKSKR